MAPKLPPRVRGQIEYFTSPYEQTFFGDLRNATYFMTRVGRQVAKLRDAVPSVILFASVYTYGNTTHAKNSLEHRY